MFNIVQYVPFLPERMKTEKVEKLVANLHDKTEEIINLRNVKQALNHRLALKKVQSYQIQSKCLAKTIYWYVNRSKRKQKLIL